MKMEKKYIDMDQLFRCDTCHHHRSGKCDTWCENGESYRPDVSIIKTADVAPVVHGEWVLEAQEGNANYAWIVTAKCSACGDYIGVIWRGLFPNSPDVIAERTALDCAGQITLKAYCSECGAKMDGGKE